MALLAAGIGRRFTAGTLRVNVFGLALQDALSDMSVTSLSGVSLEDSAGFLFLSFAFAMGLHAEGARAGAWLLGTRLVPNEFVTFLTLAQSGGAGLD
jgi:nucleoside permease NupC